MEYQIITDGAADITKEEGAKRGIVVVPFYVYSTQDVNRKFADVDELYEEMLKNPKEVFKTACPSPEEYYRKFRAAVDEGKGVFCVTISQKFSGSYSSAVLAANMIAEETPDAKVRVIDSQMNSALQGLFVDEIEKMAPGRAFLSGNFQACRRLDPAGEKSCLPWGISITCAPAADRRFEICDYQDAVRPPPDHHAGRGYQVRRAGHRHSRRNEKGRRKRGGLLFPNRFPHGGLFLCGGIRR